MKSNYHRLFSLPVLLICIVAANAQTYRGTIRGTIYDPNRAVITGAEIKLTNTDTNQTRMTATGANGDYSISSLQPGSYDVSVQAQGFELFKQTLRLSVNQELRVDVDMRLGGTPGDFVSVVSTKDLKEDSASLGTVIENSQIQGLPLDGRNFYELTLLVPGAVPAAARCLGRPLAGQGLRHP